MPEVQIGNYGRPGVYINEFDNSQFLETQLVEGIQNLVIGFAKKGPFNTPVVINTLSDLEAVFGPLDRKLERKGSFFHRTIQKLLQSDPVVAINLLNTDDNLDTLEYQSMSSSTNALNDVKRTGAYKNFFDRSGFWKKDTEPFLAMSNLNPNSDQRIINFTNMGEKPISMFIFKSTRQGFDVDMIQWFGTPDKVPAYVYPTDLVSDYMVDVVVMAGDWTNYQALSVDSRWGQYFSTSGLIKSEVLDFVNDPASTTLSYYQGLSLMPYFRDGDGRDIFIENVINRNTDKDGLFCAYDIDKVQDADFPMGNLDIIGNNIAGNPNIEAIDMLSYKDSVSEVIKIEETLLGRAGNSFTLGANNTTFSGTASKRASQNKEEGFLSGLTITDQTAGNTIIYDIATTNAFAIMGGSEVTIQPANLQIDTTTYTTLNGTGTTDTVTKFISTIVLDTTGTVKLINNTTGNTPISGATGFVPTFTDEPLNPIPSATDIVLGYFTFELRDNGTAPSAIENQTYVPVNLSGSAFEGLKGHIGATVNTDIEDYIIRLNANGDLTVEFLDTASASNPADYFKYRRFQKFNQLINLLTGPNKEKSVMILEDSSFEKLSLANIVVKDIKSTNVENKAFTIETGIDMTGLINPITTGAVVNGTSGLTETTGALSFFMIDDEIIFDSTTETITTTNILPTATAGVVGRFSKLYENYRDGIINTGDFFYKNELDSTEVYEFSFEDFNGDDYIVIKTVSGNPFVYIPSTNQKVIVPNAVLNAQTFTITDPNDMAANLGYTAINIKAFKVTENTIPELVTGNELWNENEQLFIRMFFDATENLTLDFVDSTLGSVIPAQNEVLSIKSKKVNFIQTVEIETPSNYTPLANKILINAERYTEVKVGDFLSADVDLTTLQVGEVPKYMTRILSKKLYSDDTTLLEITCDSAIRKVSPSSNGDFQTLRFTKVEDYITTYKGFAFKGFQPRLDSMPDGTEVRQSEILNLVAENTNLFKALTNKETINFRYIVDSFGLGLTEFSKQQLMDIAGERLDCFAFLNMPSMKSFRNSPSPFFLDDEGVLSTEFIAQGGDPNSNPTFLYSFGEGKGQSASGYFAPYLTINDNGRPLDVPPAAWVASTYLRKFNTTTTNIRPWTISAGVRNGQVTGIAALEMDFTNEDIVNLNQMKANPIVTKRNRGFVIETENTAQTFTRSALSFIHSREVLIELEQELNDMLLNFQWQFNTPEVRAEIKLRADLICERYVNQGGLVSFFNKIDRENNTDELIANQFGVLDTYVTITSGLAVIVNNITILKTGAISSGGFL